jgi:histidinol dehydrogenase
MTPEEMKAAIEAEEVKRDNDFASALNELSRQHQRRIEAVPVYVPAGNGAYITSAELRVVRVTA